MLNAAVTQATIGTTICVKGYTATIRPPTSYTEPLKVAQIAAYGYADTNVADYEEDHVIALELGGAPSSAGNLYPQPRSSSGADDALANALHDKVCAGAVTLAAAQDQLLTVKVSHGYRLATSLAAQVAAPTSRAPVTTAAPVASTSGATDVFYANCAAVRAAGKAPLYRGQPGYRSPLDRDGDGIACE